MRLFLDVLYYYTYKFYTTILNEEDPHATTIWGIGMIIGAPVGIFIMFLCDHLFEPSKTVAIGIGIVIAAFWLYITYRYYIKGRRARKIIKNKPFIISNRFSIFMISGFYISLIGSILVIAFTYRNISDNKEKLIPETLKEWLQEDVFSIKNENEDINEEFSLDSLLLNM